MDESQQEVIQAEVPEVPAPELEATAAPEPEVTDAPEEKPVEQAAKVFTQEELDAAIGKRLAREQRKWEREQRLKAEEAKLKTSVPAELPPADSLPPEEYAELLAERKAAELIERREQARIQAELIEQYHEREEEARSKYDDFEQVAYNPKLPITDVMAQTIQASEIGPEMAYYLGSNPKEAERISKLSPFMQAKEIGKIEAKLSDNPPVKKTSNAPAPIAPVTARTSSSPAYDTTDPRSIKSMSTSEWIEAERQRQIKKLEAMRNR
jgi:hypothetical protein